MSSEHFSPERGRVFFKDSEEKRHARHSCNPPPCSTHCSEHCGKLTSSFHLYRSSAAHEGQFDISYPSSEPAFGHAVIFICILLSILSA